MSPRVNESMSRITKACAALVLSLIAAVAAHSAFFQGRRSQPALPDLIPPGPSLVVHSKNFSALLKGWNGSEEKALWLQSDNFQTFSRSRLYLRLQEVYGQFAEAAGFPADLSALQTVAGSESALGLYDIGRLEFLYLTRMPAARIGDTVLWRSRAKYQSRNSAGLPYYLRTDLSSHRVVGFATTDNLLLLATREDLLAGALALIAGKTDRSVKTDGWYERIVRASGQPGDLRLVMNLEAIVRSPYFRSYWVQQNVSDLRQFGAGVSDIHLGTDGITEDRVLLRAGANAEIAPGTGSLGELTRFVPDGTGLYRAWALPRIDFALDLLERKILAPHSIGSVPSSTAPSVALTEGQVGSEADLEMRIDETISADGNDSFNAEALRRLLASMKLEAMLQIQSSKTLSDRVLVGNRSAIVLQAGSDWDGQLVRQALLEAV